MYFFQPIVALINHLLTYLLTYLMTVTVVSIKGPYPYASDVYNFIGPRRLKLESCNFHPMTQVSSWLTSLRNAKGNIGAGARMTEG